MNINENDLNTSVKLSETELFLLLLGGIYLFWPDLMQVEGFWFSFIAIWLCFFVSWVLFGDIADAISAVNKYKA